MISLFQIMKMSYPGTLILSAFSGPAWDSIGDGDYLDDKGDSACPSFLQTVTASRRKASFFKDQSKFTPFLEGIQSPLTPSPTGGLQREDDFGSPRGT